VLEIEKRERLPSGVPHDEARVVMLIERPRRREAVRGGHGAMVARRRVGTDGSAAELAS